MPNLTKKIQNLAHQNNLWQKGDKIIIGISGGADSVCLFRILLSLAPKHNFSLHLAHVNYGLRGSDSQQDEKFVRKLAQKYSIPIDVLEVADLNPKKINENALRQIRYDFFEKIRQKTGFDSIAVAHNQNDQAETVLLHLLRGSGLGGLAAMQAKNQKIIRPLLNVSRDEIISHLKSHKQKFRTDKTNFQPIFQRNKIRLRLIPYLKKNFNPQIETALVNLAETSAQNFTFIQEVAQKENFIQTQKNQIVFSSKKFRQKPRAIARQCLRQAIGSIDNIFFELNLNHFKEIEKIIQSSKNKTQKGRFGALKIEKKGDIVILSLSKK